MTPLRRLSVISLGIALMVGAGSVAGQQSQSSGGEDLNLGPPPSGGANAIVDPGPEVDPPPFGEADLNGDGVLNTDEASNALPNRNIPDLDGDGVIDRNEIGLVMPGLGYSSNDEEPVDQEAYAEIVAEIREPFEDDSDGGESASGTNTASSEGG